MDLGTLLIVNGLVDYAIQVPAYTRFARNNTHGAELNDTIVDYMETALHIETTGCLDMLALCAAYEEIGDQTLFDDFQCSSASALCRNAAELPYLQYSPSQSPYDVRNHSLYPQPPGAFPLWLNTGAVQQAIGVDLNYSQTSSPEVLSAFHFSGDVVRTQPLRDLTELLDAGVRVVLMFGDADYACNWLGGETLSLAVNYTGAEEFRQAGYTPLISNDKRYGDVREAGFFSFTRLFDAGHAVPFYQPEASLAMFNRTINGWDIATGAQRSHAGYSTKGDMLSKYSQKEGDGDA